MVAETDSRYPLSIRGVAKQISEHTINSSVGPNNANMRHSVTPSTSTAAQALSETQIHPLITSSTAIVACVHADPWGFSDSLSHKATFTPPAVDGYLRMTSLSNSEVPDLVAAKGSTVPPYNIALMWCCDTLKGDGSTGSPASFNLLNRPGVAYLGFDETVAAWLKPENHEPQYPIDCTSPLDLHAKKVLDFLKAGDTVLEAVNKANNAYPPRKGIETPGTLCPTLPMQIRGDIWARLYNVYLTPSERISYPGAINSWYVILS